MVVSTGGTLIIFIVSIFKKWFPFKGQGYLITSHIYIAKNITLLDILKFAIKRFLKLPQEKSNVQKKICKKIGMF